MPMDRVTEYAERVVYGDGVYGELHKLACKRHLDDLKRQEPTISRIYGTKSPQTESWTSQKRSR